MIDPNTLSDNLRKLASAIANAKSPSKSAVLAHMSRIIASVESGLDLKTQREIEKQTKDTVKKTQDDLGKKMEDLVKKGVSGEDITRAVGDVEKDFDDLERQKR